MQIHPSLKFKNFIGLNLFSWTLLSLWIGIGYTTFYTSHLTKPGHTKLINTIEDFIDNDMMWGTYYLYADFEASLNASSNPAYHELRRRIKVFKDKDEAEAGLKTGKFGVYGGISNKKYFVTYDWNEQLHLLTSYRLMKECIFNYYSVFALQKFSSYTELFSDHALKFQEYGFSQFWFSVVYRDKAWLETFLEDHPRESNEPKPLAFPSISGALLVLFACHMLSFIVFACEMVFNNSLRRIIVSRGLHRQQSSQLLPS